jgi:phosphatidylinositol-bisphosphatase
MSTNAEEADGYSADSLERTIPGAYPDPFSPAAFSTQQSLSRAIFDRRAEYTKPKTIRIKVGTWNVAAKKGTEKDIGGWFVDGKGVEEKLAGLDISAEAQDRRESVEDQEARRTRRHPTIPRNDAGSIPGGKEVGLYVIGLQEIVDVSSTAEALRPYTDPTTANKYKDSISAALPPGYSLVAEQQLIGLLLLIYASPAVAPDVKSVSTTSVGTGIMGYMGNKVVIVHTCLKLLEADIPKGCGHSSNRLGPNHSIGFYQQPPRSRRR